MAVGGILVGLGNVVVEDRAERPDVGADSIRVAVVLAHSDSNRVAQPSNVNSSVSQ